MSLFRAAIILSLGVSLMPSDKAEQERLYARAATAANWTLTFCDRNAQSCETAGQLWTGFLTKAEFAAKMAYDLSQRDAGDAGNEVAPAAYGADQPQPRVFKNTLTVDDLKPLWRGKASKRGI